MIRKALVEGGTVCGIPAADPRITAFKGIPFAAPPTGENRWRAPQPVIPWTGELQCWNFAPISMQHIPGLNPDNIYTREWNVDPEIPMDEDCLYLNVWTPAKSAEEKLPVFVWYFGGGLVEGNPAEMEFDGERIARRGIVVVTVNYRLNAFGFLAHPELTTSQPEAPTNFGHLDQQAGTRWVQRNIAAFGGDPEIPGWDNPGTFHSSDLWFWFETLAKCWRPFTGKHYDLARLMCNYMANFIRSGDPNGCDADGSPMPEWKPLRDAEPHAMHWGDHAVPMVDTPDDLIRLQVKAWSDRY